MIKVGVIGCGKIAQVRHLPEYAGRDDVEIISVYDVSQERALAAAEQYGCSAVERYQDILDDPRIDAVSVCAANAVHCEITVQALKAGKHVLCEKPMATTLAECEEMVHTARETGKFLMIGHNQRLAGAHARARELVAAGEIGEIISFKTSFGHGGPETWAIDAQNIWFFDKSAAAFGAIGDLGIHKTDLIQYLTGQRVAEVMAFVGTLDKRYRNGELIGVDDNAMCIYKMDGGAVGTMTASWTYYGPEDNATILYGTEGIMHIYDDPEHSIKIYRRNGEAVFYDIDLIQTNDSQTKSGIIDMWIDALINEEMPELSGEEALHAMKAVFAAIESGETGRKVQIQ